jgi:hypothetical protein
MLSLLTPNSKTLPSIKDAQSQKPIKREVLLVEEDDDSDSVCLFIYYIQ